MTATGSVQSDESRSPRPLQAPSTVEQLWVYLGDESKKTMENTQQQKRSAEEALGNDAAGGEFEDLFKELAGMYVPPVKNADNALLGPVAGPVGFVDSVAGDGAREVPEFIPTVDELEALFEHWFNQRMDIRLFMFMTSSWGSSDARIRDFAARRIDRIWALLGQERGQQLRDRLYEEFWEREKNPRLREYFEKGKLPPAVAEKWANGEPEDEADWTDEDQWKVD